MSSYFHPARLLVACLAFCLFLTSCEKETITTAGTNDSSEPMMRKVEEVPLSEIRVSVADGRLVFADLSEFAKARKAIGRASRDQIDTWHKGLRFKSMYSAYIEWSEALTTEESALTVDVPPYVYKSGKNEVTYDLNSYSIVNSHLASPNGEFLVNRELHKITFDRHIHIPSGDHSMIPADLSSAVTDNTTGVYVRNYKPLAMSEVIGDLKDVDRNIRTCPINPSTDPADQLRIESRDDANGRRMTAGVVLTVTDTRSGGNVVKVNGSAEVYARHQRKSGFIWKADYGNTSSEEDIIDFELIRRPYGELRPNNCGSSCVDDPWTVFGFDGAADQVGFTHTSSGFEHSTFTFDDVEFFNSALTNQPQGSFTLRDLRYDLSVGQARMVRTNSPILEVEVGCL